LGHSIKKEWNSGKLIDANASRETDSYGRIECVEKDAHDIMNDKSESMSFRDKVP